MSPLSFSISNYPQASIEAAPARPVAAAGAAIVLTPAIDTASPIERETSAEADALAGSTVTADARKHPIANRVLVLTPTGRDGDLACKVLGGAGIYCETIESAFALGDEIEKGVGAVLLAEEALAPGVVGHCKQILAGQPPWSDLPLVVLIHNQAQAPARNTAELMELSGNVTLLERPIRVVTLVSAMQVALRARRRQYQTRDLLLQLEAGVRQRDEFLAMLGHELRNPLGTIQNAVHVLNVIDEETLDDHEVEESRQRTIIERQSRHLAHLIDDLLDVSRITQGKIRLQMATVDLRDVVDRSLQSVEPEIEANRHQLSLNRSTRPATVQGDPVRLEQIVTNLLTNAIKYTPPGGLITVVVEHSGNEVAVSVQDNGAGIAPELKDGIFDLFQQVERSLDRSKGGLGIGLTVVRRLVEMHHGRVSVASDGLGLGSTFRMCLPYAAAPPSTGDHGTSNVAVTPRHILIVEDNPDARIVLQIMLKLMGHRVDIADNGVAGVELAVEQHPDIALIDLGLPGLDGFEVARRIRASMGSAIFLIALTGYGQPDDRDNALDAGFDMHLTKPVEPDDLAGILAAAKTS